MKIRKNHSPYMTKVLRKTIVKRTQRQTKYFKYQTEKDYASFKKNELILPKHKEKSTMKILTLKRY